MTRPDISIITNPALSTRLDDFTIEYIPIESASSFVIGRGINLENLLEPKPVITSPFLNENVVPPFADSIVPGAIQQANSAFIEDVDEERRAISIFVNFKAK